MTDETDRSLLLIIAQAARTVGESLDWVDHGGGERAWQLIHAQPAVVREAYEQLGAKARAGLGREHVARFERHPEQGWSRLEDAARKLLVPSA